MQFKFCWSGTKFANSMLNTVLDWLKNYVITWNRERDITFSSCLDFFDFLFPAEEETLKSPTAVRAAWAVLNSTNTTDSTQTTPNTSVESSSLNSSAESPLEKPPEAKRPQSLETETPRRRRQGLPPVPEPQQLRSLSDHCFIGLFWAIVLVRVWIHVWILQLLPILFAFLFVKKIGEYLWFGGISHTYKNIVIVYCNFELIVKSIIDPYVDFWKNL